MILNRMTSQQFHQMRVRMPLEVKAALENRCYKQRKTMNRFIVETLITELDRLNMIEMEKINAKK